MLIGRLSAHLAGGLFLLMLSACSCFSPERNEQGWSKDEQWRWYRASQGSRLIPYEWLMALEQAANTEAFMSTANVRHFGYLAPDVPDETGLPIGFAIDRSNDANLSITKMRWFEGQGNTERWTGLNCSACHTAEIEYNGQRLRIDGGPTIADFQSFQEALNDALVATRDDTAKWNRFADAVLAKHSTPSTRPLNDRLLRQEFEKLVAWQQELERLNATSSRYGNARLDAIGHIFNRVALLTRAQQPFGGPPDAPVSYPFIWNVHQHDFVQWNGIAPNRGAKLPSGEIFDIGALGRNTGEVIGVFADVVIPDKTVLLRGYQSSVDVQNLDAMETQLSRLKSPPWPTALFGPLDTAQVSEGKTLFTTKHCITCHAQLDREDVKTPIVAKMSPIWGDPATHPVGTDPWMACNTFTYQALSGNLKGVAAGYFDSATKIQEVDFTRTLLITTTTGVLMGKKVDLVKTAARAFFGLPRKPEVAAFTEVLETREQKTKEARLADCMVHQDEKLMAYKARPLNGIWATAPYLHNGSVRTLRELLLAPAKRAPSFHVGNRNYDKENVGYVDEPSENSSVFRTADEAGNPIPGNSNAGHDYGNDSLTEAQIKALIEYMKSL